MIRLVTGNPSEKPSEKPATYTRFVLPFAYHLVKDQRTEPEVRFEPKAPDNEIWRRRYLTDETQAVLFQRAKWFSLNTPPQTITVETGGRQLAVGVQPAKIILFEYSAKESCRKDSPDPLRCGFLVQELFFPREGATLEDLLRINELFRYWQRPYDGHEKKEGEYFRLLSPLPLSPPKPEPSIGNHQEGSDIYFDRWASLLELPLKDEEGGCWRLAPDEWFKVARDRVVGSSPPKVTDPSWLVYADNRAYTWTCAIVEGGAKLLRPPEQDGEKKPSDHWLWTRLLNVDPPHWGETSAFEKDLCARQTYRRWEHDGSLYGFTYYSGALLAPPQMNPNLANSFGQMYFDQSLLLLYIRVTAFRFSSELSRISSEVRDEGKGDGWQDWKEKFTILRWRFTLFTNLYQFPLLSNQQQGVELYTLARREMGVDDLFREVQQEIHSSHEFLSSVYEQEQTEQSTTLTVVATVGLILGLVFSFLGMNVIVSPDGSQWLNGVHWLIWLGLVGAFSLLMAGILKISKRLGEYFLCLHKAGETIDGDRCRLFKGGRK